MNHPTTQSQENQDNRWAALSLSFWREILADFHPRNFAVRLWNDTTLEAEEGQPTLFTFVLRHPGALRKMFLPANERTLGEAYIYDDFDVEGNLESAFALVEYLTRQNRGVGQNLKSLFQLLRLPSGSRARGGRQAARLTGRRHSTERDRQAVTYHYDVSNDFFSLWLGKRMLYSCAYFATPSDDLDTAQERKLDYVCRKLRLRPGERLLDIGCGWGGLLIYAASKYGVNAVGITLSRPQADLAMDWVRREGLSDRCQVLVKDYREVSALGMFDKLVSIGMFEHVGESRLPEYFERAWEVLHPGGVFLNHGIAQMVPMAPRKGPSFSEHYVFPDGELLPISMTLRIAEEKGFEVRDLESLREHYSLTLRHWIRRLEARREEARSVTDESTYRVWRLFMSGAAHQFESCETNVYQALFVKPHQGKSGFPLTRNDWYQ